MELGGGSATALEAAAAALQRDPRLKPTRGPVPTVPMIAAAILLARGDVLSARAACRLVGNVKETSHHRVRKLADKVRPLISVGQQPPLTIEADAAEPACNDVDQPMDGIANAMAGSDGSGDEYDPWDAYAGAQLQEELVAQQMFEDHCMQLSPSWESMVAQALAEERAEYERQTRRILSDSDSDTEPEPPSEPPSFSGYEIQQRRAVVDNAAKLVELARSQLQEADTSAILSDCKRAWLRKELDKSEAYHNEAVCALKWAEEHESTGVTWAVPASWCVH